MRHLSEFKFLHGGEGSQAGEVTHSGEVKKTRVNMQS